MSSGMGIFLGLCIVALAVRGGLAQVAGARYDAAFDECLDEIRERLDKLDGGDDIDPDGLDWGDA